jgi:hypothetical protein
VPSPISFPKTHIPGGPVGLYAVRCTLLPSLTHRATSTFIVPCSILIIQKIKMLNKEFSIFNFEQKQKTPHLLMKGFSKKGDDILSHITAVPSAQAGLTSLFGMGRGEPRRNNHLKPFCKGTGFRSGNNT